MKPLIKFAIPFLLLVIVSFISCKKDNLPASLNKPPKPPVAVAGQDQAIRFPADSASLDGGASTNANGNIAKYLWTKISGPDTFTIVSPASAKTTVKELVKGVYGFELKVTNYEGLFSKDTILVIVYDPSQ